MTSRASKLQRWTDLLAALLRRHYPATFEELARDVPAYSDPSKNPNAIMRMFERDKDELRAFGISIETVPIEDGEMTGYRLERKGFYLPYLSLVSRDGKSKTSPKRIARYGYHSLPSLTFEPDELEIIISAAKRVQSLGDPVLSAEAESALKKLAFDLPLFDVVAKEAPPFEEAAVRARPLATPAFSAMVELRAPLAMQRPEPIVFEVLNDALSRRKRVSFDYHTIGSDTHSRRNAEPYGLFFLSVHWYLAARDIDKSQIRNFRLSRMSNVAINAARSQTPDYTIPADFILRDHARSRQAWDLGDTAGQEAIVDFTSASGAAQAAAKLGVAVEGASGRRKFNIRRLDSFARWLLSFGGDAVPREPEELVKEFGRQLDETRTMYQRSETTVERK
jgi:proteasome accessory factor B